MAEPIKMIFTDGLELAAERCPNCGCARLVDYACPGCEAKRYRDAAAELKKTLNALIGPVQRSLAAFER